MRLRTVTLVIGLALIISLTPLATPAQRVGEILRIGVINGASPSPAQPVRGFQQGLRELGYREGRFLRAA